MDKKSIDKKSIDKKIKKKVHALNERIQKLRQQLAGAKKQADNPEELTSLEKQLADAEVKVAALKEF